MLTSKCLFNILRPVLEGRVKKSCLQIVEDFCGLRKVLSMTESYVELDGKCEQHFFRELSRYRRPTPLISVFVPGLNASERVARLQKFFISQGYEILRQSQGVVSGIAILTPYEC
jgi:hypothetical protein